MKEHDLRPRHGSRHKVKRVGRGTAAGQGKTAGRGTKGQGARAGSGGHLYRQGGSLPFVRTLPFKRGFTNIRRAKWQAVNVDRLAGFAAGSKVTPQTLKEAGLIADPANPVAILGRGTLKAALTVHAHRVSAGARAKIEAAGGKIELLTE
jgi:large subunit ribosomal protein L15